MSHGLLILAGLGGYLLVAVVFFTVLGFSHGGVAEKNGPPENIPGQAHTAENKSDAGGNTKAGSH